jgi:hypothetical protein
MTERERVLEAYTHWWDPTRLPKQYVSFVPVSVGSGRRAYLSGRPPPPHCGTWYALEAPLPRTARWAILHCAHPPYRILYATSREAALNMLGEMSLRDHPHLRLVAVDARLPEVLAAFRSRAHGGSHDR